ncbi:MAG: hypothetical protein ED559_13615 [Phycisphaera sp.]|nr:MAG: hypothetical protein ED559_13615 [Phycisphaera sp.]
MNQIQTAVLVSLLAGASQAQTELLLYLEVDQEIAMPGETVTWTFFAELLNPDPNQEILAVVSNISFDLEHTDGAGSQILNNRFAPAFDSDFFGPADPGVVVGNQILGASGSNVLPPLNNADGPDSSNALEIYSFQTLIIDDTPREFTAGVSALHGQLDGAYAGSPFANIITYQRADGSPGDVPIAFLPILSLPSVTVVPAPATLVMLGFGAAVCIRRDDR